MTKHPSQNSHSLSDVTDEAILFPHSRKERHDMVTTKQLKHEMLLTFLAAAKSKNISNALAQHIY